MWNNELKYKAMNYYSQDQQQQQQYRVSLHQKVFEGSQWINESRTSLKLQINHWTNDSKVNWCLLLISFNKLNAFKWLFLFVFDLFDFAFISFCLSKFILFCFAFAFAFLCFCSCFQTTIIKWNKKKINSINLLVLHSIRCNWHLLLLLINCLIFFFFFFFVC